MQNDEVLQATLLLSCYFNKSEVRRIKPLTPTEYARFAAWLHQQKLTPADLLRDQSAVSEKWLDPKGKITAERIKSLLARGASMGFALEQWAKHGVWVVSRPNVNYPQKLKSMLGDTRPPVFFGVGNQALLNQPGIGFVGSRTIDATDESFAQAKAELAISKELIVISGGAKGIDQTAMCAALECGGQAVGIIAENLLKTSTMKAYREGLKENRLALISPFYPEAGFNIGNAMARNKYIYAMSEAVVVIKSDFNKGGTWSGAKENIKKGWVPLLVRDVAFEGNQELIKLGGIPIDESLDDFTALSTQAISLIIQPSQGEQSVINEIDSEPEIEIKESEEKLSSKFELDEATPTDQADTEQESDDKQQDKPFIEFTELLKQLLEESGKVTLAELKEKRKDLKPKQITDWLDRASEEGWVERQGRLRTYTLKKQEVQQDLF